MPEFRQQPSIADNLIFDNHAGFDGGGISFCFLRGAAAPIPRVEHNVIRNNTGRCGGGIYTGDVQGLALVACTIIRNEASEYGGGMYLLFDTVVDSVSNCTLAMNSAREGGSGIALSNYSMVEVHNTVVAFGLGSEAFCCQDSGNVASLTCTDIYGNQGGDWTGCIAGLLGVNGNFAQDPLFCAPILDDFSLAEGSPCAPENSPAGCGLIGAWPVACVTVRAAGEGPRPAKLHFTVTPNPIRSVATFTFAGIESPALEIYDPNGRLIELLESTGQSATWLPGNGVPPGVYFARLHGAEGARAVKFLVVRW